MRRILLFPMFTLTVIFFIMSCSSSSRMGDKTSNEKYREKPGVINENFDPMNLDKEEIQIQKTRNTESQSDNIDLFLQDTSEEQSSGETIGYRVQICAVTDEQKAREIQRDAILSFIDENIYLKYDAPYYKVRIGDFVKKEDADRLKEIAISRGFNDAWVVRTKVKVNPQKRVPPQQPDQQPPNQ